jgi:E3 ubiquitin-protein ligase HUWE1
VQVFNSDELEAAICGNQFIDLEDWKNNTEVKGYGPWSVTVTRFWKCMATYTQAELARIL